MAEPRNHHFVPQGYLRSFADGVGRQARLVVMDRVEGKVFRTKVRNIGAARDFNRVDVDGFDPNALETAFAEFEGPATTALRRIADSGSFTVEEDRILVLNLVALLAARNPRLRGRVGDFLTEVATKMARNMVTSGERWERITRAAREASDKAGDWPEFSYEDMREFIMSDGYEVVPNQTFQIGLEMKMVDTILRSLVPRKWSLLVADDEAGEFVTSDHPVCLLDLVGKPSGGFDGVGFGMSKTAVIFPVSRKLLLSGQFEGKDSVRKAGAIDVAQLNSQIIQRAERQVYAYDDTFAYFRWDKLCRGSELISDPLFLKGGHAGSMHERSARRRDNA